MATRTFEEYATHDSAYLTQWDRPAREDVSTTVIEAVATVTETSVLELEPLYEATDPDALEAVVRSSEWAVVEFDYHGCRVLVCSEGGVVVLEQ